MNQIESSQREHFNQKNLWSIIPDEVCFKIFEIIFAEYDEKVWRVQNPCLLPISKLILVDRNFRQLSMAFIHYILDKHPVNIVEFGIKTAKGSIQFLLFYGRSVRHLKISSIPLKPKQLQDLIGHCPNAVSISLNNICLTPTHIDALSTHNNKLRILDLFLCMIGDVGIKRLVNTPSIVKNLEYLNLQGNNIKGAGAIEIAISKGFQNLRSLKLRHNPLTRDGVMAICNATNLKQCEKDVSFS